MACCKAVGSLLFTYKTPKILNIRTVSVGIISRIIQLAIFSYIIGYVLVYNKGYQEFCEVESAVTTKVKGVAYTDFPNEQFNPEIEHPEWYRRVWDIADFVVPPTENGAAFIATNVIITANQQQGTCPEHVNVTGALCTTDKDCIKGKSLTLGNGVLTGKCIPISSGSKLKTCEIQAWCPLETDVPPLKHNIPLLETSENFTILIKNFVDFPLFKKNRRNIKDTSNSTYLKSCLYDDENKECPVFRLGDMVRLAGYEFDDIAYQGGVIAVFIRWDCNFDPLSKKCFPTYSFSRLDDPNSKISPGWNFRYADYYGDTKRTLYKLYGIKISIIVEGRGGQFRIIPLLLNVGAGLGLLAVEVVICDIIVLYITKRRRYFMSKKFEPVDADDELSDMVEEGNVQHSPLVPPKMKSPGD